MSEFMSQLTEMCSDPWHQHSGPWLLKYVALGDRSALESVRRMKRSNWELVWFKPWEFLGSPETFSDEEKRALEASVYLGDVAGITDWLKSQLQDSPPNADAYLAAYLGAFGQDKDARVHAASALIASQQRGWLEDAARAAQCGRDVAPVAVRPRAGHRQHDHHLVSGRRAVLSQARAGSRPESAEPDHHTSLQTRRETSPGCGGV